MTSSEGEVACGGEVGGRDWEERKEWKLWLGCKINNYFKNVFLLGLFPLEFFCGNMLSRILKTYGGL